MVKTPLSVFKGIGVWGLGKLCYHEAMDEIPADSWVQAGPLKRDLANLMVYGTSG